MNAKREKADLARKLGQEQRVLEAQEKVLGILQRVNEDKGPLVARRIMRMVAAYYGHAVPEDETLHLLAGAFKAKKAARS